MASLTCSPPASLCLSPPISLSQKNISLHKEERIKKCETVQFSTKENNCLEKKVIILFVISITSHHIIMAITIVILLASLASLVLLDSEHPCPMGKATNAIFSRILLTKLSQLTKLNFKSYRNHFSPDWVKIYFGNSSKLPK